MRGAVSLFPYIGGKFYLVDYLVDLVQQCYRKHPNIHTFVEGCGGGGRLILNLPRRCRTEIYNDIDPHLSNLFWTVSDIGRVVQLINELEKMPESYDNYIRIYEKYGDMPVDWNSNCAPLTEATRIKSAAYVYYLAHLAYRGMIGRPGIYNTSTFGRKKRNIDENNKTFDAYRRSFNKLLDFPAILQGVEVFNGDCRWFLEKYKDDENVLLTLDPPYLEDDYKELKLQLESAGLDANNYTFEDILNNYNKLEVSKPLDNLYTSGSTIKLQADIVLLMRKTKAKVILNGYYNSFYADLLNYDNWRCFKLKDQAVFSSRSKQKRKGEFVWINF